MAENKKKVYLITFKCDCILGECAQIINDECGLNDLGYRLDFEQKKTILFLRYLNWIKT